MALTLSDIKNKTKSARNAEEMRQYPMAIREYFASERGRMDGLYNNRPTDAQIQRYRSIKYPVDDRDYGSPNEEICNIYLNLLNTKEVNEIIDEMIFEREWVFHPIRPFETWTTISLRYYADPDMFWLILLFNRISDPFTALQNFNMIRIPNESFVQRIPYRIDFDFSNTNF
jgi:hypothetical protein